MTSKLIPAGRRTQAWLTEGGFTSWDPDDNVSPEQAVEAAGLDTPVTLHPVYSHNGTPIPNKVETWRDGHHLAVVGKDSYHAVQFRDDVLPFINALLLESPYRVIAAGKYDEGRKEVMAFQWPENLTVHGEEFTGYGYVFNSNDGSSSINFTTDMTRMSCTNQQRGLLKGNTFKIRHTRSWARHLQDAIAALGVRLQAEERFIAEMERDLGLSFSDNEFQVFLDEIAPVRDERNLMKEGRGLTMAVNARDSMLASWNAPDLANVRNTLYGAKQAMVAYYDWGYSSDKSRGIRAISGSTDRNKAHAARVLEAIAL